MTMTPVDTVAADVLELMAAATAAETRFGTQQRLWASAYADAMARVVGLARAVSVDLDDVDRQGIMERALASFVARWAIESVVAFATEPLPSEPGMSRLLPNWIRAEAGSMHAACVSLWRELLVLGRRAQFRRPTATPAAPDASKPRTCRLVLRRPSRCRRWGDDDDNDNDNDRDVCAGDGDGDGGGELYADTGRASLAYVALAVVEDEDDAGQRRKWPTPMPPRSGSASGALSGARIVLNRLQSTLAYVHRMSVALSSMCADDACDQAYQPDAASSSRRTPEIGAARVEQMNKQATKQAHTKSRKKSAAAQRSRPAQATSSAVPEQKTTRCPQTQQPSTDAGMLLLGFGARVARNRDLVGKTLKLCHAQAHAYIVGAVPATDLPRLPGDLRVNAAGADAALQVEERVVFDDEAWRAARCAKLKDDADFMASLAAARRAFAEHAQVVRERLPHRAFDPLMLRTMHVLLVANSNLTMHALHELRERDARRLLL